MDSNRVFDCIVVGAGIEGSSSAYQLAKKSCNTLLLEQFYLPHSRGSSHGPSRIVRYAHKNLVMTKMMTESFAMWHELEMEANTKLYRKTGMLVIEFDTPTLANDPWDKVFSDIPHECLTSKQLNQRYAGIKYNDNYKARMEIPAGTLMSDKALRCYQDLFVKYGGKLQDGEQVLQIIPGTMVTVKTTKGTYSTKNLVLTPGSWASQLLQQIGLQPPLMVERLNVCYWRERSPGLLSTFPAFADISFKNKSSSGLIFGLPIDEYPGLMKVCLHHGDRQAISNPDNRDMEKNNEDIHTLSKFIKEHFPGLEDSPAIVEECLYMSTPDYTPIIDKHPVFPNIAFACGMSGVGFKFAPVFGKIIAEFVMGKETDYDLKCFRHDRFNQKETVKSKL